MTILSIKDLNFSYEKSLFKDFNLDIKSGTWITLMGPNGSGKSTLIKIITGVIKTDANIILDDIKLNSNIIEFRKKIGIIFDNPNDTFVCETVFEEIAFVLENLKYSKSTIRKKINEIAEFLNIKEILKSSIKTLNNNQKNLVSLASILVLKPKVLIVDELLDQLDYDDKVKFIKILKDLNKEGMTIINVTHDIENTLCGNEILILNQGNIVIQGPTKKVLEKEQLLNELGFKQPFMIELSNKLKFYGLIDKTILDMKRMVNQLWK